MKLVTIAPIGGGEAVNVNPSYVVSVRRMLNSGHTRVGLSTGEEIFTTDSVSAVVEKINAAFL